MSTDMSWSPNFCLYCDKQTPESVYCSQSCRLADLETAALSAPVSPSHEYSGSSAEAMLSFSNSRSSKAHSQFLTPGPFSFSPHSGYSASSRFESPPTSPRSSTTESHRSYHPINYHPNPPALRRQHSDYSQTKHRSLNTSTSRTSLSSISSTSSVPGLSDQAIAQLQRYSNSFDHTRDWKRRTTLG